jgi:arylsulfatase A-like enzyme
LTNELSRRKQTWTAAGKTGKMIRHNQMPEGRHGMVSQNYDWGAEEGKPIDQDTAEFAQKVLAEPHDRPRFMAFGIFRPHIPFLAPAQNFTRYPKGILPPMPADDFDDIPSASGTFIDYLGFQYDYVIKQPPGSPGGLQEMVRCYEAASDYADELVGKILDALDASGKADNTIIILWSDNGFHLGDKKCVTKLTLWEKACHVPFIIVAPGVTKLGSRISEPVSLVDIYPTLAELTGVQPAHGLDGESLVPLLKTPSGHFGQYELMSLYKGNHAVCSEFYRYIRYADGSEELYDHRTDPWEHNNLASNPECKGIIEQHRKFMPSVEAAPGVTIKDLQARGLWNKKSGKEKGSGKGVSPVI